MIKKIFIICILILNLNANDDLSAQKQNTLYVQNLIEIEEKIAKSFEKYILTEFKLPAMSDLINDNYLGSNFSIKNRMGIDIDFLDTKELQIKYLITKNEYRNSENFTVQLYNRDLYRDFTTVYFELESDKKIDTTKSYVEIKLQSDEAKNIFNLLKNNFTIQKTCTPTLVSTYCSNGLKTIRWYNASSQYIEYSKKEFNKGNVILSGAGIAGDSKLQDLMVGAYLFIGGERYVKLVNDSSGDLQIIKVN